jgi:hypothetical protein
MGLIVISDLFCFDLVVFSMGADETYINHLKLALDGYDQPVRISLDVEYDPVVAKNASRTVRSFDGLRAAPIGSLHLCIPRPERMLGIRMPFPKRLQGLHRDNPHDSE